MEENKSIQKRKSNRDIRPFTKPTVTGRKRYAKPVYTRPEVTKFAHLIEKPLSDRYVLRLPNDMFLDENGLYQTREDLKHGMASFSAFKRVLLVRYIEKTQTVVVKLSTESHYDCGNIKGVTERLYSKGDTDLKKLADTILLYNTVFGRKEEQERPVLYRPQKAEIQKTHFDRSDPDLEADDSIIYKKLPGTQMDFAAEMILFNYNFFKKLKFKPQDLCDYIIKYGLPSLVTPGDYKKFMTNHLQRILDPPKNEQMPWVEILNGAGENVLITVEINNRFVTDENNNEYMISDFISQVKGPAKSTGYKDGWKKEADENEFRPSTFKMKKVGENELTGKEDLIALYYKKEC